MPTIIRRRKLGRTSCRAISGLSRKGIQVVRSDRKLPEDGLYIRWGCTADVPSRNVLNTAAAIHEVNDKVGFRQLLNDYELCPETWFETAAVIMPAQGVIVRPSSHSRGRQLWHYATMGAVEARWEALGGNGYISEYIPKVAEYRVFVVSGRCVAVAKKTPGNPDDVAWNVAEGGRFDNVRFDEWPLKAVKTSIEAFNLSSLDFGGVDVMVDEDGSCYVLEINSAPSLTSPYRQECMAKAFDHIIEHGKARIPLIAERGGYTKFIHPSICERAKL